MSTRPSHAITTAPAQPPTPPAPVGLPGAPRASAARSRQRLGVLVLATAVLIGGGAWAAWVSRREGGPARPDDLLLCWRFAALRNAHEPGADKLLGPGPKATEGPVTEDEAERLDAAAFLRRDLRVVDVRPDDSEKTAHRFILVTKGAASGDPLRVRAGDKVERTQRVMTNPDVVVEVRDGKLDGVRVQLGMD